jgi:hypothetical protein
MGKLIVTGVLTFVVLTKSSAAAAATPVPSKQEVLTFIADTIDWFRHLPMARQLETEAADLVFLGNNQSIATEIVRLSFELGKAVAAIARNSANSEFAPDSPDLKYLTAAKAQMDEETQQAVGQLKSLTQARLIARRADRKKLDTQMAEIQTRIQVLNAMSANYQNLLGVARATTASERATTMEALVENLERTVPDVAAATPPALQMSNLPADPSSASYGTMGMISRISTLTRKAQFIDGAIQRTDELNESVRKMRTLFIEPFRKQFSTLSLDAKSLDALQQQQSRRDLPSTGTARPPGPGAARLRSGEAHVSLSAFLYHLLPHFRSYAGRGAGADLPAII